MNSRLEADVEFLFSLSDEKLVYEIGIL